MDIDIIRPPDLIKIQEIHNEFYDHEFNLGEFLDHGLCTFTAKQNGKIVTAGSVRTLVELVAITDKSYSSRVRLRGLHELLQTAGFVAQRSGYSQIHAFVQDPMWAQQMKNRGFRPTIGEALVTEV